MSPFPIHKLQDAQEDWLAEFHRGRPRHFDEIKQRNLRLGDVIGRLREVSIQYEVFAHENGRLLGNNKTIAMYKPTQGLKIPPRVPTLSKNSYQAGDWFPLEGLGPYYNSISQQVIDEEMKIARKRRRRGSSWAPSPFVEQHHEKLLAKLKALEPAKDISLTWDDWHNFAYGIRCATHHGSPIDTLGLGEKPTFGALNQERRRKMRCFLQALASPCISAKRGRDFARCMLALFDLAEHPKPIIKDYAIECFGRTDTTPCVYGIPCKYVHALTEDLFYGIHLWYPRLLRRLAIELHNATYREKPAAFVGYVPRRIADIRQSQHREQRNSACDHVNELQKGLHIPSRTMHLYRSRGKEVRSRKKKKALHRIGNGSYVSTVVVISMFLFGLFQNSS